MLLVVTYSRAARRTLRNAARTHEDSVVRSFGRAVLFEETAFGAFLAIRLRAEHGGDVQVERTRPFNEFAAVSDPVREAATAYADRDHPSTPYAKFAAGRDFPAPETLKDTEL